VSTQLFPLTFENVGTGGNYTAEIFRSERAKRAGRSSTGGSMMNGDETRKYQMLARVREFGISHAAAFPPGTMAAHLLAEVETAVQRLSIHSVAQATGTGIVREGAANRRKLREALRDDLEAMMRTARDMSDRLPNIVAKFRTPPRGRDQALLDTALAFAAEATPLKAEFAQHELGEAFFAKLEADIAAFDAVFTAQMRGRETRVAATAAIADALASGMRAARKLGTIVKNKFAGDPVTLQAWASASRIQRSRSARAPQPESANTTP
jgi:hypothetical protein